MQEDRHESRFFKSYKYKHKRLRPAEANIEKEPTICDNRKCTSKNPDHVQCHVKNKRSSRRAAPVGSYRNFLFLDPLRIRLCLLMVLKFLLLLPHHSKAFCPLKCLCDDQSLSANCTQVPSITIIPMTFNPLLKQLTLNHLPMIELSNSLSVYRQLEYLNLNSNLLRQIKYQNFNFKPAPPSVLLATTSHHHQTPTADSKLPSTLAAGPNLSQFELTNTNNEQMARHLKQAIDRSVSQSVQASAAAAAAAAASNPNSEDEIGFHLRDLDLGDNRIDQLGSLNELEEDDEFATGGGGSSQMANNNNNNNLRLRSTELERLAPFLTLTRLENLNLSGNRLSKLHQHAFLGLIHLKRLDLSRNQLESIDQHAFVGLIELELLKLDHNRLASHLSALSVAFCRAPMMELRFLDLGTNYKSSSYQDLEVLLPNQMFICAPRLVSLKLDGLQLRYIQVNAFDNLQQLETLNLSQNYLESVPSDPLSYSNSNLSLSLRQLDLSDNLIEFVNARSFGALRNLQKLCMNSMDRMVSFDLSSLSIRYIMKHRHYDASSSSFGGPNGDRQNMVLASDSNRSSLLLWQQQQHDLNAINLTTNYANFLAQATHENGGHGGGPPINHGNEVQLINDQLIELQLKHNPRLQSLHSSLAARQTPPRGRIRFSKLRLLDLQQAVELRDFPLDKMMDLAWTEGQSYSDKLRVDLSLVAKLNCSSCQMSWLVGAVKQQLQQQRTAASLQFEPPAAPYDPFNGHTESRVVLLSGSIGCSWPFAMPLVQLIDLETSYAPIFDQNCLLPENSADSLQQQQQPRGSGEAMDPKMAINRQHVELAISEQPHLATPDRQQNSSDPSFSSLALATLLALVVICVCFKLGQVLLFRRWRSHGFKWRSPSLAPSSIESPSGSSQNASGHSPADCSSSSILSTAVLANGLYGHKHQQQQYESRPHKQQAPLEPNGKHQRQQLLGPLNNQLIFDAGGFSHGNNVVAAGPMVDAYCRRVTAAGPGQIERAHLERQRGGNLFSRIVGRLSAATSWRPSPLDLARPTSFSRGSGRQETASGIRIIENIVYGGTGGSIDDKILANHSATTEISNFQPATLVYVGATGAPPPMVASNPPCRMDPKAGTVSSDHSRMPTGETLKPRGLKTDFIKPAYCQSRDGGGFVYANCKPEGASSEGGGGGGGLVMGPTSYSYHQLLKLQQLEAIGTDPASSLSGDSPQATCHTKRQQQLWRLQQEPRYSSEAGPSSRGGGGGALEPALDENSYSSAANSQLQPTYLSYGAGSQLQGTLSSSSSSSSSSPASKFAATGRLVATGPGGEPSAIEAIPVDGHIYVTLDRPIKQQNGCDEYERYERPQQQQLEHQELEHQPSRVRPNKLAPLESCFPDAKERNCPVEDYKSFEWSSSFAQTAAAGEAHGYSEANAVGPLEMGDKFKLAQEVAGGAQVGAGRQHKQQLVGQLGGKLSSSFQPLQETEGNIRQQQPITSVVGPGIKMGEAPFEVPTSSNGKQWQFARVSPVASALQLQDRDPFAPGGGVQMCGKNGNNSDFTESYHSRKQSSKKSRRFAEEKGREPTTTGDVTGHTDHLAAAADDDDDDYDVGNGFTQRGSNGNGAHQAAQLNGRHRQHENGRQLFMDLNSPAVETTNELRASKFGPPEGGVTSPASGLARHDGSSGSKYDANHGSTLVATQHSRQTANRHTNGGGGHCDGGRPAGRNSSHNCVINGLQSQQLVSRQMGVSRNKAGHNNNAITSNNSTTAANCMMDNEGSIVIGQRDFVAKSSPNGPLELAEATANGLIVMGDVSDCLYGQQKLCDISHEEGQESGGAIMGARGPTAARSASTVGPSDSHQKGSALQSLTPANSGHISNNNEIYSNQFYYCRPAAASTLARAARSNEAKSSRREETNHR